MVRFWPPFVRLMLTVFSMDDEEVLRRWVKEAERVYSDYLAKGGVDDS